jgi:hypothetical protein
MPLFAVDNNTVGKVHTVSDIQKPILLNICFEVLSSGDYFMVNKTNAYFLFGEVHCTKYAYYLPYFYEIFFVLNTLILK